MAEPKVAVVIPIGPGPLDVPRAVCLLSSLFAQERSVGWCVLMEDRLTSSGLTELSTIPHTCRTVSLRNPRHGRGYGHTGGLCAGVLTAFRWLRDHTDAQFVVKLDTDALVIAPFACAVRTCFARWPEAGVIGTIGFSCNRALRKLQDQRREPDLLRLHRLLRAQRIEVDATAPYVRVDGLGRIHVQLVHSFARVRPDIEHAIAAGYAISEYCQGGAYAVSRLMLERMHAAGYLEHADRWTWIPVGEDMIMAMYACAVKLTVADCSNPGQPFGVQAQGLPHPPEMLSELGYSLIHSVRNDPRFSESEILSHFGVRVNPSCSSDDEHSI